MHHLPRQGRPKLVKDGTHSQGYIRIRKQGRRYLRASDRKLVPSLSLEALSGASRLTVGGRGGIDLDSIFCEIEYVVCWRWDDRLYVSYS